MWFTFLAVLVFSVKLTSASKPQNVPHKDMPLIKSLGLPKPKLGKNPEDRRMGQEYIEQYQEMLRASQESFENFDERDEKRLRRVISNDEFQLMAEAEGAPSKRRSDKLQSVAGARRARSQAVRMHKLTSQGIRSHLLHSKQTNIEYNTEY